MKLQLTSYQEDAVSELLKSTRKLLRQSDNRKLVFKAPTGSGKTIMMAEFLAQFADDETLPPCAFIWTATRQLHEQSKEKLEVWVEIKTPTSPRDPVGVLHIYRHKTLLYVSLINALLDEI